MKIYIYITIKQITKRKWEYLKIYYLHTIFNLAKITDVVILVHFWYYNK